MIKHLVEDECRNCAGPLMENEKDLVLCDRCDERLRVNADNNPYLAAMILRGDYSNEQMTMMSALPNHILYSSAANGFQLVVLAHDESIRDAQQASPIVKPPIIQLLEKVNGGNCLCGRDHDNISPDDSFMHYNPQSRIAHLVHGTSDEMFLSGFLCVYYERFAPKYLRELGDAGFELQKARAFLQTTEWDRELVESNPEDRAEAERRMSYIKGFVISTRAIADGHGDFLAQLKLASLGLLPECPPERLNLVCPEGRTILQVEEQVATLLLPDLKKQTNEMTREKERNNTDRGNSLKDLIQSNIF